MLARTEDASPESRSRLLGLIAAIASISVVGMNIGLGLPLLSLTLTRLGYSSSEIGFNTIAGGLGALVIMPFIGAIAKRIGAAPLLFAALLISSVSFVLFYVFPDIRIWLVLRFFYHGSIAVAFTVSEFWISAAADEKRRGFILGIYGAMLAIGFSLGPTLLALLGDEGFMPYMVGAGLMTLASLPVLLALRASPSMHSEEHHGSVFRFMLEFPEAALSAFVYGVVETGIMAMIAVYGLALGYGNATAALLGLALSVGNIASQVPLGWMSDRFNKQKMLLGAGVVSALLMALLPLGAESKIAVFGLIGLAASLCPTLYMVGLSEIAARLKGAQQATGNASFIMMYALGALIGPTAFGIGLDLIRPQGFALVGASVMGAYALFIATRLFLGKTP